MIKSHVTDFLTYKWRYRIGYLLVMFVLFGILIFIGLNIPGGISSQEMQSAIISDSMDISTVSINDYIFHLTQHFSIKLFGLSNISIKLPSILFASLSVVGMSILLKKWYKPNIGILATLIAITTGQFMFIAQNGTPDIMILFWSVYLVMTTSFIIDENTRHKKIAALAFCTIAALSLYTPLTIYILVAIVAAAFIHPHLRYKLRRIKIKNIIIGLVIFILLSVPNIIHLIGDLGNLMVLSGIPSTTPDIAENLSILTTEYLGFNRPGGELYSTPVFELGSMLFILIGAYQVFKDRASSKSYIISLIVLCLIPITLLNPTNMTIVFLPLVLLLTTGLRKLLTSWYGLFPLNPYARIGGLIPIVILVSVLVVSGLNRYVFIYQYNPTIVNSFVIDLKLIPENTKKIIVSEAELPFYKILGNHNDNIEIDTVFSGDSFIATRDARVQTNGYIIEKIITNSRKNNSDRFYLYKKTTN